MINVFCRRKSFSRSAGLTGRLRRRARSYGFGDVRAALLALLTLTALLGWPSRGVIIAKFSGHAAIFRS